MIVLDASACVELVAGGTRGAAIADRLEGQSICAPALLDVEVVSALRSLAVRGRLELGEAEAALDDYLDLRVARYGHEPLLGRIWVLRDSLSAYDAAYVALAEGLDCPLLTCDEHVTRAHGHDAQVVLT